MAAPKKPVPKKPVPMKPKAAPKKRFNAFGVEITPADEARDKALRTRVKKDLGKTAGKGKIQQSTGSKMNDADAAKKAGYAK